jgi:hypothetical protein
LFCCKKREQKIVLFTHTKSRQPETKAGQAIIAKRKGRESNAWISKKSMHPVVASQVFFDLTPKRIWLPRHTQATPELSPPSASH